MKKSNRVLFVDDEPSVTSGIRVALRKASFEVVIANSGQEALERLAEAPVDVIVSDERMPGMTGSELLSRVRDQYPDTVRMILSGQADLSAAVRAINEAEIFRFLLKPCEPDNLADSVTEAIEALEARRRFSEWHSDNEGQQASSGEILERALGTISMNFQPIFAQPGDRIHAYEALVRLGDPEVSNPDQLFGLAEAVGGVADADAAIREAIAKRMDEAPDGVDVFVNVHPNSLLDERIFSADDPLAPYARKIVIEVTERSSLLDHDIFETQIGRLRECGYRIALDDLGAGYAGLSSFALMTPDVVKFDMGLIRGIHEDATRALLVESMVAVCREMEILTVAEGVETEAERDRVFELGCDLIQGYLFARPTGTF